VPVLYETCLENNDKLPGIISGRMKEAVTEGWRQLHNKGLHNLYSSTNRPIITVTELKRLRWAGHVARMRNKYKNFIGKPKGKTPSERITRGYENNIKMDKRQICRSQWSCGLKCARH
jgi:hypothetical protein